MTATLEAANEALRTAVRERLDNTPKDDPKVVGYSHSPTESCCEGTRMRSEVHPTSQAFFELCDQLKELHRLKSSDYGSADDPLANIRNGAEFVGIEAWRAAMVRLSDKVTRLATYCRTGSLTFEGVEDTLFDLASYSLLTLLTHREAKREP
jgi:hypothetical protein